MVYLPGMEVYASAGGGSADDQLEGPFTVVVPTTTTAGSTCQKEEVLSLFGPPFSHVECLERLFELCSYVSRFPHGWQIECVK